MKKPEVLHLQNWQVLQDTMKQALEKALIWKESDFLRLYHALAQEMNERPLAFVQRLETYLTFIDRLFELRPEGALWCSYLLSQSDTLDGLIPSTDAQEGVLHRLAEKMVRALGRGQLEHTREGIQLLTHTVYRIGDHRGLLGQNTEHVTRYFEWMLEHLSLFSPDPHQRSWSIQASAVMLSNGDLKWHEIFMRLAGSGLQANESDPFDTRVKLLQMMGSQSPENMIYLMEHYPDEMVEVDQRLNHPGMHQHLMSHPSYAAHYEMQTTRRHLMDAIDRTDFKAGVGRKI